MIDYIKIYLENIDIQKLLASPILDFKGELSKSTGAINESTLVAEYHFCKIIVKTSNLNQSHVLFTGSIHKMWNSINNITAPNFDPQKTYKGFNGNLFSLDDVFAAKHHLEKLFDCTAFQMIFQNIEIGINAQVDFKPNIYIKGLLYHKNAPFNFSHFGNNAQAVHQQFVFKIYNKSYQYKLPENTLRIELKFLKMVGMKETGIKSFADISTNTFLKAQTLILKRFDEVMHYDYTIIKNKLTKVKLQSLTNYSNPRYWIEDVKPIHRDRHKKQLQKITIRFSDNLQNKVRHEIIQKCVIINQAYTPLMCNV